MILTVNAGATTYGPYLRPCCRGSKAERKPSSLGPYSQATPSALENSSCIFLLDLLTPLRPSCLNKTLVRLTSPTICTIQATQHHRNASRVASLRYNPDLPPANQAHLEAGEHSDELPDSSDFHAVALRLYQPATVKALHYAPLLTVPDDLI